MERYLPNLNILPDDVLYLVFNNFTQLELFNTKNVCRRFREIVLRRKYWKSVKVDHAFSTEQLCKILKTITHRVEELSISNRSDCDIILKHVYKYNKRVTSIKLVNCRGRPLRNFITSDVMIGLAKNLPNLKNLELSKTFHKSEKFFQILKTQTRYTGALNFKQLAAYVKNADLHGIVKFMFSMELVEDRVVPITSMRTFIETEECVLMLKQYLPRLIFELNTIQ